jgi:hypothetical protein
VVHAFQISHSRGRGQEDYGLRPPTQTVHETLSEQTIWVWWWSSLTLATLEAYIRGPSSKAGGGQKVRPFLKNI